MYNFIPHKIILAMYNFQNSEDINIREGRTLRIVVMGWHHMSVCMIKEHCRLNPDNMCCDLVLLLLTLSTHARNKVIVVVLSVCLSVML